MPIKKARNTMRQASRVSLPEPARKFPFWTIFAILMLYAGLFIVASLAYLLYRQQVVHESAIRQLEENQVMARGVQYQYKQTLVTNLFLQYEACRPSFTGACDDAKVYRLAADGSKQIIIPSVRSLAGAPMGSELLQPLEQSPDARYIVFGAWAYGSVRNAKDTRVWIYDAQVGQVTVRANVPSDAVYSPDYTRAAYGILNNNDIREIAVVNVKDGKVTTVAKAAVNMTFMEPGSNRPILVWRDAQTLVVNQYSREGFGRPLDIENEQIHVKIK